MKISGVHFAQLWDLLSDREQLKRVASSFSFDGLDKKIAKRFIAILRKEQLQFCLKFDNLNQKQAQHIIETADLSQEEIQINKVYYINSIILVLN